MRRAELGAGEWYSNCDMCQLEEGGRGGGGGAQTHLQVVVLVYCAEALEDAVDFAALGEVGGPRDDVQVDEALGEQLGGGAAEGHGRCGRGWDCPV